MPSSDSSPRLPLRLTTLGTAGLVDAHGVSIGSLLAQPKRVATLVYLACAAPPSGFHPRDRLLPMFWPDFDDERARNSLRTALHYLRRSLGPEVLIGRSDGCLGLSRARIQCDAWEFELAVSEERWADALALYGGEFLDGFVAPDLPEFERWVESRRLHLRRKMADALWNRSVEEEDTGAVECAIELGRRALHLFPANELTLRRLLTLLHRAGDRAAALTEYEGFVQRMQEQFEMEPSPETRRLVESIATSSQDGVDAGSALAAAVTRSEPSRSSPGETRAAAAPPREPSIPKPPPLPRPRRRLVGPRITGVPGRFAGPGLLTGLGVGGFGLVALLSAATLDPAPDPGMTAVAPFEYHGSDRFRSLGPSLSLAVGHRIAQEGGGVIAGDLIEPESGRDGARDAARKAGAGRLILGEVVESQGRVRVHLRVLATDGPPHVHGSFVIEGASDAGFTLADDVAARLAAGLRTSFGARGTPSR